MSNLNSSRVHPASCIKNGIVVCPCDFPANRLISHTAKNPERPFYRCSKRNNGDCSFFKWESDLLRVGLIPPQASAPPSTPQQPSQQQQHENGTIAPITPKQSLTTLPLSPPCTQPSLKGHMYTGSQPSPGASQKATPEERARRLANILTGEAGGFATDERPGFFAPVANSSAPKQSYSIVTNTDGDNLPEHESFKRESNMGEDEFAMPANKRTRLENVVKAEEEEVQAALTSEPQLDVPITPPRRSTASQHVQLPTPSHTLEREGTLEAEAQHLFDSSGPSSPTLFTKGAQRARERAQNVASSALMSNKGKARALEDTEPSGVMKIGRTYDSQPTAAFVASSREFTQENYHEREHELERESESVASQLASTFGRADTDVGTSTPRSHNDSRDGSEFPTSFSGTQSSAYAAMSSTALSSNASQLVAEMGARLRALERDNARPWASEPDTTRLRAEIEELKARNAELESCFD